MADDIERLKAEHAELVKALTEMVTAHSMQNVGVDASRRRIAAITDARALLARVKS